MYMGVSEEGRVGRGQGGPPYFNILNSPISPHFPFPLSPVKAKDGGNRCVQCIRCRSCVYSE